MKVVLLILDGWGHSLEQKGNAIVAANLPTIRMLEQYYPFFLLKAAGISVGLPWAEPGNSEVGHLTIGSGRMVLQAMPRIIRAIQNGSFFQNEALLGAVNHVKKHDSQLHLMGLLGSASVHSYIDHLYGLLDLASREGISSRVKLHVFTDGKDSPPHEGAKTLAHVMMRLEAQKQGEIATIVGRNYAMDRNYNWEKTQVAFDLLVEGKGEVVRDGIEALKLAYHEGLSDDEIPPLVWAKDDEGTPRGVIQKNDAIVFFNYRGDSERQLTKAFALPNMVGFTPRVPDNIFFVTLTEYSKDIPVHVAFMPPVIENTLSEVLARQRKTQLHIAETQKYAHITYFFNGLKETRHEGEEWQLIPSLNPSDYITHPELKIPEITSLICQGIEKRSYDFILANFANADLLGHTGNFEAAIQGCQHADAAIKEILASLERVWQSDPNILLIIGADHGNAELMVDPISSERLTGHTPNDVIYYFIAPHIKKAYSPLEIMSRKKSTYGTLADISPTILLFLGIPRPPEMTGRPLPLSQPS